MATKDVKKSPPRPKRPKADVEAEFEDLQRELEIGRRNSDVKTVELELERKTQVREAVADVDVETIVQRLAGLGLDLSKALSEIAQKLTAEVSLLATLREAVAAERDELSRLHKIDVAATALDQLVTAYAEQKSRTEHEIKEQREAWDSEIARVERERKEQDESFKKQRQREIEDYEYKKSLERKKTQDRFEEEQRATERKNAERQEALEKDWLRRESALKAQEDELARLQKEVAAFPAQQQKEIQAATAEGRRQAESKYEQQILVLKKDADSESRIADLRVKGMEASLAASAAQIAALERQLAEAKQQVQDIAVRAIDGASGARALSHINQIAMEQAKNRPQG